MTPRRTLGAFFVADLMLGYVGVLLFIGGTSTSIQLVGAVLATGALFAAAVLVGVFLAVRRRAASPPPVPLILGPPLYDQKVWDVLEEDEEKASKPAEDGTAPLDPETFGLPEGEPADVPIEGDS